MSHTQWGVYIRQGCNRSAIIVHSCLPLQFHRLGEPLTVSGHSQGGRYGQAQGNGFIVPGCSWSFPPLWSPNPASASIQPWIPPCLEC